MPEGPHAQGSGFPSKEFTVRSLAPPEIVLLIQKQSILFI